jgi:hypothetical protein
MAVETSKPFSRLFRIVVLALSLYRLLTAQQVPQRLTAAGFSLT